MNKKRLFSITHVCVCINTKQEININYKRKYQVNIKYDAHSEIFYIEIKYRNNMKKSQLGDK